MLSEKFVVVVIEVDYFLRTMACLQSSVSEEFGCPTIPCPNCGRPYPVSRGSRPEYLMAFKKLLADNCTPSSRCKTSSVPLREVEVKKLEHYHKDGRCGSQEARDAVAKHDAMVTKHDAEHKHWEVKSYGRSIN